MKARTKEETEVFIAEAFPVGAYCDAKCEVAVSDDLVRVRIAQMYEYVECGLKQLLALSEFFGTTNIEDSRWHSNGCDTCDYGSSYEIELTIRPDQPSDAGADIEVTEVT